MWKSIKCVLLFLIVALALFYAEKHIDAQNGSKNGTEDKHHDYKEFDSTFLPQSTTGVIVAHQYYTLSYSETYEQAEWVAYELQEGHLSNNTYDRPYFETDPKINTGSAHWRSYKNSGFDRGHLCPAGDRQFSYEAFQETFLTSNISPQDHDFNAGVWNSLEQKVRYWAQKYDGVYVITGGVLEPNLQTIGEDRVAVPKEFYKILFDASEETYKVLAFLIPNVPTQKSFYDFVVTVDDVEAKTGIDFFAHLPDSLENRMESQIDLKSWGKR